MSDEIKALKQPTSIDEQFELLRERGLIVEKEAARKVLSIITYYRLSAYMLTLKKDNKFFNGIRLEDILSLYYFDEDLRSLIFRMLGTVEITARSTIANYFSIKYGSLGYLNRDNYNFEENFNEFKNEFEKAVENCKTEKFIKHHKDNYDGVLPCWVAVEIISFGSFSKMYSNMLIEDRKGIAKELKTNYLLLDSWLHSLSVLRNRCAHHNRLYGCYVGKQIMIHNKYSKVSIHNRSLFANLLAIKELFFDQVRWNEHVYELINLIEKYNIRVDYLGFTTNWRDLLLYKN